MLSSNPQRGQDLARARLIELGHTWGRWRLHHPVRLYADQLGRTYTDIDQRAAALSRLYDSPPHHHPGR